MEDKVTISIEKFEELLRCKFKLEFLEEVIGEMRADKYQAEVECRKYRELYEAKLKQEAEEFRERAKRNDENQPLRSGECEADQSGTD